MCVDYKDRFHDEVDMPEQDFCKECGAVITFEQFEDGYCYSCDTDYDIMRCEVCGLIYGTCDCEEG